MKLSLVQTFSTKFRSQMPDAEKPGVYKSLEFQAGFKLFPQNEDTKAELQRLQDDKGVKGFLDHVMESCTPITPSDLEFSDAEGNDMKCEDFVKSHLILQQDALLSFWETVNKGVEEKNSKRSRSR